MSAFTGTKPSLSFPSPSRIRAFRSLSLVTGPSEGSRARVARTGQVLSVSINVWAAAGTESSRHRARPVFTDLCPGISDISESNVSRLERGPGVTTRYALRIRCDRNASRILRAACDPLRPLSSRSTSPTAAESCRFRSTCFAVEKCISLRIHYFLPARLDIRVQSVERRCGARSASQISR